MLVIIIPAGIIAALICFRWARTVAMICFLLLMVWFVGGRR